MLLEAPNALRAWLARVLAPKTDADPSYLSKYVLALLKKNKPEDELRGVLLSSLDVFLQKETDSFVDELLKTLAEKSYVNEPIVDEVTVAPDSTTANPAGGSDGRQKNKSGDEKTEGFGGNKLRSPLRESNAPARRSRSRSRSPRALRERRREYRGPGAGAPWRQDGNNHRGARWRGPMSRRMRRSRSRSPANGGGGGGGAVRRRRTSRSRSRSRSWSPGRGERNRGRSFSPTMEDEHPVSKDDFRRLCQDFFRGQRCEDFNSKGLCLRGDQCPYDHGSDPVRVDGGVLPQVLGLGPVGPQLPVVPPFPPPMFPVGQADMGFHVPPPPLPPGFAPRGMPPPMGMGRPPFFSGPMMGHMPFNPRMGRGGMRPPGPKRDPKNCSLEIRKIPAKENDIVTLSSHFAKFGKIVNIQVNYNDLHDAALITFALPSEAHAAFKSPEPVLNNRFIRVFWHDGSANDPELSKAAKEEEEVQKAAEAKEQKAKAIAAIHKQQELILTRQTAKKLEEDTKKEAMKLTTTLVKQRALLLEKQLEQQRKLIAKLELGKSTLSPEEKDKLRSTIKSLQTSIEATKLDMGAAGAKSALPARPKTKQEVEKELLDMELELYSKQEVGADATELQKKVVELKQLAAVMSVPTPVMPGAKVMRPSFRGRGITRAHPYAFRGARFSSRGRGFATAQQFNSTTTSLDKRPKRFLVTGFLENEKENVIRHFSKFTGMTNHVSDDAIPSLTFEFKSRLEAEIALSKGRSFEEKMLSVNWCVDSSTKSGQTTDSSVVSGEEACVGSATNEDVKPKIEDHSEEEDDNVSITTGRKRSLMSSLDESSLLGEDETADLTHEESVDDEILLLGDDDDEEEEEDDKERRSWRR
ncbi:unnamed protein product [Notodromas monacha]|uniref:C3H1-type domain-containing protein n=1 Tax=Notodromas monacha TaxID=399045 RepID=A0A7R9GGN7_9CRUS|nr:unnamed protein product [Notodromas monacha]CAG0922037.1 unnamed protein product [Notodromas monacha]